MLISVTIPVFNDPEGLKSSLVSLCEQSYENWEAIVVDDGSNVDLSSIVNQFGDRRIIFHRFETNRGRPHARQKTFDLLTGDYCAFLDAGDTYSPDYLENAVKLFENQDLLGVSQSMTIVYDNEIYISSYSDDTFDVKNSRFSKISFASTIFKSIVSHNYIFNEKLKFSQDRHFLNFVANNHKGKVAVVDTHGYIYNQGSKIRVSTTYKKYYYDLIRLIDEKKYVDAFKGVPKLLILPLVHLIFGYKSLLNMRFSKK